MHARSFSEGKNINIFFLSRIHKTTRTVSGLERIALSLHADGLLLVFLCLWFLLGSLPPKADEHSLPGFVSPCAFPHG